MNRILLLLTLFLSIFNLPAQDTSDEKTVTVSLAIKVFPQDAIVWINGKPVEADRIDAPTSYYTVTTDLPRLRVSFFAESYWSKYVDIAVKDITAHFLLEQKLERTASALQLLGEVKTGGAPKSVEEIPGKRQFQAALLNGPGINIVDMPPLSRDFSHHPDFHLPSDWNASFQPDLYTPQLTNPDLPEEIVKVRGFVESAFTEDYTFVSQMHTSQMHVLDRDTSEYKASVQLGGTLCKVICISDDEKRAYVSNWISEDISVVSLEGEVSDFKEIKRIPMPGIPRGMVLDKSGQYLYVALFNHAILVKVDVKDFKIVKKIGSGYGAMRHLVRHDDTLYASDMYHGHILAYDLNTDKLVKKLFIGPKLNTIAISSDGKYLFVSSRGENNPKSYYIKGPEFGKIYVVRTDDFKVVDWVWGRNQPTGLCLSQDDSYLAFTDFLDNNMEIYDIRGLWP